MDGSTALHLFFYPLIQAPHSNSSNLPLTFPEPYLPMLQFILREGVDIHACNEVKPTNALIYLCHHFSLDRKERQSGV